MGIAEITRIGSMGLGQGNRPSNQGIVTMRNRSLFFISSRAVCNELGLGERTMSLKSPVRFGFMTQMNWPQVLER